MAASLDQTKENIERAGIARKHADSLEKRDILVDGILNPSKDDHKKIKHFQRINKKIKQKFLSFEVFEFKEPVKFSEEKNLNITAGQWDKRLSDYIKEILPEEFSKMTFSDYVRCTKPVEGELLKAIQTIYNDWRIEFLESKFALFGFMRERATDEKKTPKLYLWQGEADAIAYSWELEKFIIVDFKVVDNLLYYWQKKTDLYGKHLHQCLVYAKLLQLHMDLDYLPPIMIVVIDRFTGRQGFLPLFEDLPDECKDKLDEYEWFTKQPPKLPLKIVKNDKLFREDISDSIVWLIHNPDRENSINFSSGARLNEIFKDTATVQDLLEALHLDYDTLKIVSH